MKNKKHQHGTVNTNLIHNAIFYILETCAITWPSMEDTFLNIPLDPWRSQWSSGRRRILTEGWALLCFQNTVQLVQGACVLQHLWSSNAPRVKERNRSTMGATMSFSIPLKSSVYLTQFNTFRSSIPGLLKHYCYRSANKRQWERSKRRHKKWLSRIKLKTWEKKRREQKRIKSKW